MMRFQKVLIQVIQMLRCDILEFQITDGRVNPPTHAFVSIVRRMLQDLRCQLVLQNIIRVLLKCYIRFCSWNEISEKMSISLRWAYILHGKALQAMETVLQAIEGENEK